MGVMESQKLAAGSVPAAADLPPLSRGRRALIGTLIALVGVTGVIVASGLGSWRRRRRPRERDLAEANFYGPHDLAG